MTRWFNTPLQLHRRWKQTKEFDMKNNKCQIIGGRYALMHKIGQGASGVVHLAIDVKTNKKYAIKELSKSRLERQYQSEILCKSGPAGRRARPLSASSCIDPSKKRKLNNNNQQQQQQQQQSTLLQDIFPSLTEEVEILKQLPSHPNVMKFIDYIDNDQEHSDSIFIVTEFAEKGIIMDVTPHSVTKPLSSHQCRQIFTQLTDAIDHLHQHDIVHRDIKPQNIVTTSDNVVKLIDFGNATRITDSLGSNRNSAGSPAFMAPELLSKGSRRNQQKTSFSPTCADVWSMGVTLYCLVYGHLPFEKSSLMDLYGDIQNKAVSHSNKIDTDLKDLLDKLLEKNPDNRITIQEIKLHPWLQSKK